jgi:hypothetical protein
MSATTYAGIEDRARAIRKAIEALAKRKPPTTRNAARDAEARADIMRQIERDKHELHCLCVEAGIAAHDPSRYGNRRVGMSFGRDLMEFRREPNLSVALTSSRESESGHG